MKYIKESKEYQISVIIKISDIIKQQVSECFNGFDVDFMSNQLEFYYRQANYDDEFGDDEVNILKSVVSDLRMIIK